jgi:predicted anti-sigma-YlaC factor YlaD
VQLLLVDHIRGESGRLREKIDRHLRDCEECREWIGFLRQVDAGGREDRSGARLGFEKKLEKIAMEARVKSTPGRYQRRFMAALLAAAAGCILVAGGILPTIHEIVIWIGGLGSAGYTVAGLVVSAVLILSGPIFILRSGKRMEES